MEKIKKNKKLLLYGVPAYLVIIFLAIFSLYSLGAGSTAPDGYLKTSVSSAVNDTITTVSDSADGSLTFNNADANGQMFKYLIVEYIASAAPVKELVVASTYVPQFKITYTQSSAIIELWAYRQLGWVRLGFYAQVTSTETQTNTLARVTSANDTISGTTTIARNDTLTSGLTDQITVQSTGAPLNDSVRTITGSVINDGSGTDTYALINDGSGTVTGTETTAITMTDPNKIIYELVVTPDSGTKTVVFTVRGTNYLVGY